MANLEEIVSRKTENDSQWKARQQADRENLMALQDAAVMEITSSPEAYSHYLDLQGDNPAYSAGNIALAMVQDGDVTVFGTKEKWKMLGRFVPVSENGNGIHIFARSTFGKGYTLADAYDVRQTQGRPMKEVKLENDTREMESAMATLLNYTNAIEDANDAKLAEQRRAAEMYNALLRGEAAVSTGGASAPPVDYAEQLAVGGAMCTIDIPKIGVYLPVRHGTGAETLERAVGHVMGTSLPVGGAGTHAVLSAHSGMASAKLFSDIDQLVKGDVFYIHVLGEILAYEVDQIATVLPSDTSLLQIEDGQDLVTLVTCTPFGVNTHRLLVRGHRVPYAAELVVENGKTQKAASSWTQHYLTGLGIGLGVLAAAGGICFFARRRRRG